MGHILVIEPDKAEENRELAAEILALARKCPNGFQTDGSLAQMRWVMENAKGAVFELEEIYEVQFLEEINPIGAQQPLQLKRFNNSYFPEAMLFIAPDEVSLTRLIEEQ